jgi:hypothetical protein
MKQIILERIYGNMGKGFKEPFVSSELKKLDLYEKITPLISHKGKNKRFIYKRMDNFSVFINSIPVGEDDLNRGNIYLSHFIILENVFLLNPTWYIYSESFVSTIKDAEKREKDNKEISDFKKLNFIKDYEDKNTILNLIKNIIYYIPKNKKIILYMENIDEAIKLLIGTFKLIPENIAIDISFSIAIEKLNENNLCDINILLTSNKNRIPSSIQRILVNNDEDKKNINSNYIHFLEESNDFQIEKFLSFIEERKFSLENLESASKAYLIDIGKYPIKTEEDILDNIIGLFDENKLNDFLHNYINKNIPISIKTLKKIDFIINEKYGEISSPIYYKFIVKYSKNNYQYFLEKYKHDKNIFIFLLSQYKLDEKKFIKEIKKIDIINTSEVLSKFDSYDEIFYFLKYELENTISYFTSKENRFKIIKDTFAKYFEYMSNSPQKLNYYFIPLLENNIKKLNEDSINIELYCFILNEFKLLLNNENLKKLYELINRNISFESIKNKEVEKLLKENFFNPNSGLNKIKLTQIKFLLNYSIYIDENRLDKIIKILK